VSFSAGGARPDIRNCRSEGHSMKRTAKLVVLFLSPPVGLAAVPVPAQAAAAKVGPPPRPCKAIADYPNTKAAAEARQRLQEMGLKE
jgi:hypothetical protein